MVVAPAAIARSVREGGASGCPSVDSTIIGCDHSEGQRGFAEMRFSGIHVSVFGGYQPSRRPIHWEGAALFRFEAERIRELWVLGPYC
jgi:hypothetical protein